MDDLLRIFSEIVRWSMPIFGLSITFLALRRFGTSGTGIAVLGFALMLVGPVSRLLIRSFWLDRSRLDLSEYTLLLALPSVVSTFGAVFLVVALRRLMKAAERSSDFRDDSA